MIDLALKDMSMTQIAVVMKTTPGSVRTTFYRLRKAFGVKTQVALLLQFK